MNKVTDSILIIEGEPALIRELTLALTRADFEVACVPDYLEALCKLGEFKSDLAIIDEELPLWDGWEACYQLHRTFGIPVILLGRASGGEVWSRAVKAGADFYLIKPYSYLELTARVKAILRRYREEEIIRPA